MVTRVQCSKIIKSDKLNSRKKRKKCLKQLMQVSDKLPSQDNINISDMIWQTVMCGQYDHFYQPHWRQTWLLHLIHYGQNRDTPIHHNYLLTGHQAEHLTILITDDSKNSVTWSQLLQNDLDMDNLSVQRKCSVAVFSQLSSIYICSSQVFSLYMVLFEGVTVVTLPSQWVTRIILDSTNIYMDITMTKIVLMVLILLIALRTRRH